MSLERVMLALSNPATYAFLVGWALAELRAWGGWQADAT